MTESTPYYRIFVFGDLSEFDKYREQLKRELDSRLEEFGMKLGTHVELVFDQGVADFRQIASVGLYWGSKVNPSFIKPANLREHDPVIPIVSSLQDCEDHLPKRLKKLNALSTSARRNPVSQIAEVIMECFGLIPEQRRLFISYKRDETLDIALQLFNKLSEKQFNVFMDTHEIRPGKPFQKHLWHNLSDSDIMIMLDSKSYFSSKWTKKEFGRANNMHMGILRIKFPGVIHNPNMKLSDTIELCPTDFYSNVSLKNGMLESSFLLTDYIFSEILEIIEILRSKSVAVRISKLREAIRTNMASTNILSDCGPYNKMLLDNSTNSKAIYPITTVPNSHFLHKIVKDATKVRKTAKFAIIYNGKFVINNYNNHLKWLGKKIKNFRWLTPENPTKINSWSK